MGFALSASDLLEVLHRFHPNAMPLTENSPPASQQAAQTAGQPLASEGAESSDSSKISSSSAPDGVGTVTVSSDPDGAEIFIDDKFLGNAPATLKLPLVSHAVLLKSQATPTGAALSKFSSPAKSPSRPLSNNLLKQNSCARSLIVRR